MCNVWHWIGLGIVWLFCIPINIIGIIVNIRSWRRNVKEYDRITKIYAEEIDAILARRASRLDNTTLTVSEE